MSIKLKAVPSIEIIVLGSVSKSEQISQSNAEPAAGQVS